MLWFVGIFVATLCRQVEEIVSGLHQVNPAFVRRVGFGKCRRSCRIAPSFSSSFALCFRIVGSIRRRPAEPLGVGVLVTRP